MLKIIYASLLIRMIHAYPLLKTKGSTRTNSGPEDLLGKNICPFPYDDPSLASIGSQTNQGWLLTDQYSCTPESYCLYFCSSGYTVNSILLKDGYNSQDSKFGKVMCKSSGDVDRVETLCIPESSSVYLINLIDQSSTYCQRLSSNGMTLLASNEVQSNSYSSISLASSDSPSSYYVSPPGDTNARCVLGNSRDNKGLWSPYIFTLKKDGSGSIHAQLGWNSHYTNDAYWSTIDPNWGIKLICEGSTCDNKLCVIDPQKHKVNEYGDGTNDHNKDSLSCYLYAPKGSRILVTLFLRGESDKKYNIPDFPKLDLSDSQLSESDQNDEPLDSSDLSGSEESQEGQQVNEKESGNRNIDENVGGNSHISISKEGVQLTTHDESSGNADILYIKLPDQQKGVNDPVASFAKLANDPSQEPEDMNCLDSDGLGSESCLSRMAKTCQYILEKVSAYSSQMHSLFKQNNQAIQSNDHMQHNGISPTGEISLENSASNTLRRGAHWLLIIITGIIMFS